MIDHRHREHFHNDYSRFIEPSILPLEPCWHHSKLNMFKNTMCINISIFFDCEALFIPIFQKFA